MRKTRITPVKIHITHGPYFRLFRHNIKSTRRKWDPYACNIRVIFIWHSRTYFKPFWITLESSETYRDQCKHIFHTLSHPCHTVNPIIETSGATWSHLKEMETHVTPCHTHVISMSRSKPYFRPFWSILESFRLVGDPCNTHVTSMSHGKPCVRPFWSILESFRQVGDPCNTHVTSMSHSRPSFRPFWSILKSFKLVGDQCNSRVTPISHPCNTVDPLLDLSEAF